MNPMTPLLFEKFQIGYKAMKDFYPRMKRDIKWDMEQKNLEEQWFANWTVNVDKAFINVVNSFEVDVRNGLVTVECDKYGYRYRLTELGRNYFMFKAVL